MGEVALAVVELRRDPADCVATFDSGEYFQVVLQPADTGTDAIILTNKIMDWRLLLVNTRAADVL